MRRALCILLTLGSATANAADFIGDARAWTGVGVDTNPRRDFTSSNIIPPYDIFGGQLASLSGQIDTDWGGRLAGSYDFSGRKFFLVSSEDTVIQAVGLDASIFFRKYFALGLNGRIRDRRGASREYTDLESEAYFEFTPDAHVDLRLHVGARRFLYLSQFGSSHWGPTFGGSINYRFNKRHSVFLQGDYEPHSHNAEACFRLVPPPDPKEIVCVEDPAPPRRQDNLIVVAAGYTFRGPIHLTAQYAYIDSTSNSYAETYRRHRLSATLGLRLPFEFTLLLSGAIQFALYPEGLRLPSEQPMRPDLSIEGDENANTVSLKIVHPLGKRVDMDFKYAVYFNKLGDFTYLRMVGSLGIGWKW